MKLLTLWEPWASLLSTSANKIETRGWRPKDDECGVVAIHAAKGGLIKSALFDVCGRECFIGALRDAGIWDGTGHALPPNTFHFGHIIAVGVMVEALPTVSIGCLPGVFDDHPDLDTPQERAFGDYSEGRYGLVFDSVFRLERPIPYKSRQGKLLTLDGETEGLVMQQLREAAATVGLPKGLQK